MEIHPSSPAIHSRSVGRSITRRVAESRSWRLRPDVLVSDMQMPERDGAWLVAEARNRGLLKGVPGTWALSSVTDE